jgi:pyruvate,water dikinase
LVAVRSSATAEDLPDASFAGQQATFLNIQGEDEVVQAVQDAWASLFESRAIFYREQKGFDHFKVGIAVPVQEMVQSEVSGVMFTINPINNDENTLVVESVWGLGEMIVQGSATPDHFEVNKRTMKIEQTVISKQEVQLVREGEVTKERPVSKDKVAKQKVSDEVIVEVAKLGLRLEKHYQHPQDSEWAFEKGRVYIVQTRPITTINTVKSLQSSAGEFMTILVNEEGRKPLFSGAAASPGVVSGPVKVLKSPEENDLVLKGDILVAKMTTPDYVPAMKRAAAIVTDEGGQTSHAAIVSRELGVPCIVGSRVATRMLKNGDVITVDAQKGEVYRGKLKVKSEKLKLPGGVKSIREVKTKTKVYVNLGEPEMARKVAQQYVDGVGLLRAEFIISEYIGVHPRKLLAEGKRKFFIDKLAEGLAEFCGAFDKRPIVYRTTDFKTNEYRGLEGGEEFEQEEPNPMIGFRGAYRYIKDPEVFKMELEAIKKVREKMRYKNLWVMIPFVRTVDELKKVKELMVKAGLRRTRNFKLFMMAEIPNNVLILDEFLDVGIDGVSIGSNDLTMLVLGVDRDNEQVAEEFEVFDPGVLKALEIIVRTCKRRKVLCSICGQAPSLYPKLTRYLVKWGVTSVSVSPDMVDKTRLIVKAAEEYVRKHPERKKK